jgi:hypothetical protein
VNKIINEHFKQRVMKALFHFASLICITIFFTFLTAPNCAMAQQGNIPDSLKYLGQPPPGMIPVRFPPDYLLANSDWFWHGPVSFAPDLEELYWGYHEIQYPKTKIYYTSFENGQWIPASQTYFTMDDAAYNNPFFGQSQDTLWIQSSKSGGFIFRVTRTQYYWSDPVPLPLPVPQGKNPGLQFSLNQNRDVYAELDEGAMDINIYRWKKSGNIYNSPEKLDSVINSSFIDFCPFIDPDEHYLIFSSTRPGGFGGFDLYISTRNPEGTWSAPVNLGSTINTEADEWAPSITPDGLYFFFLSMRADDLGYNPYWVSADVIYQLVTGIIETGKQRTNLPFILHQNTPNPFSSETSIKYSLLHSGFVTMTIYSAMGIPVTTLVNQLMPNGTHEISFDATALAAGIYICSLRVDNAVRFIRMVILK